MYFSMYVMPIVHFVSLLFFLMNDANRFYIYIYIYIILELIFPVVFLFGDILNF